MIFELQCYVGPKCCHGNVKGLGERRERCHSIPLGSCSFRVQGRDSVLVLQVFKALRGGVQVVAVKVLHDAEVGGMNFVREIAILKGCRHTNIVQFQVQPPVCSGTPLSAHVLSFVVPKYTRM